jgi:hypothetical protein
MTDIEILKNFDKDGLIELVISLEKENEKLKRESETTCSNGEKLLLMSLDLLIDEKMKGINNRMSVISNDLYIYTDKVIKDHTEEYHDYRGYEE